MPYFGVHESISAGFDAAVRKVASVGFDCVQIFSANASRWQSKPIDPTAAERFQTALAETGVVKPLIHDSYLVNIASVDPELLAKSIEAFKAEMTRADALGVPCVVMHPGSAKDDTRENALARASRSFDQIIEELPESNRVTILVETTAGQGSYLGATFEEIAAIIDNTSFRDRFGVCFDTCHSFVAGYDFQSRDGYERTFEEFDRVIGLERLMAFHLNDAVKGLGSRLDRHAHIGYGALGLEPFRYIVNDPRFKELPMYLETPKTTNEDGEEWDAVNLRALKSLLE
ncbi:MAG: deoxyribonuclease IV [Thermoguttaceae bacterium]|nr:deoxyribonuclease IV [Thermoguttaceae bacterium]